MLLPKTAAVNSFLGVFTIHLQKTADGSAAALLPVTIPVTIFRRQSGESFPLLFLSDCGTLRKTCAERQALLKCV